jgi:hypothetical protein
MSDTNHIGHFDLERLFLGQVSETEREHMKSHIDSCDPCSVVFAEIEADEAKFRVDVPYAAFRIEHEARKERRLQSKSKGFNWGILSALALGAAGLLFALQPSPTERIKGSPAQLMFHVAQEGGARIGNVGEELSVGDVIQLSYDAAGYSHMALIGMDETQSVSVYLPKSGDTMVELPAGPRGSVPFALKLDDTPGTEHFVAIFANSAKSIAPIRRQLEQDPQSIENLSVGGDMRTSRIWVIKP